MGPGEYVVAEQRHRDVAQVKLADDRLRQRVSQCDITQLDERTVEQIELTTFVCTVVVKPGLVATVTQEDRRDVLGTILIHRVRDDERTTVVVERSLAVTCELHEVLRA